jgi:15-cis-phytoene synthase
MTPVSQSITRKSASNLAMAFILLPRDKRHAMSALYAFCRAVDDIADEEQQPLEKRAALLQDWREDIRKACQGEEPQFEINRELQPFIHRHQLAFPLFDELIQGVEMDLCTSRYQSFEQLDLYCYRVASVVGLLSIEIFGYTNPACRQYAVSLGKALQLTNILRDVRNDALRGRIYLPLDELAACQIAPAEILQLQYSDRFERLAQRVAQRARHFYAQAKETLPPAENRSMAPAELMASVYWRLLNKLEARRFNVFNPRLTRLNKAQKLFLVLRAWARAWTGTLLPNYRAS